MLVAAMEQQGKGARRLEASFFRTDGAVRTIVVEAGQPITRRDVIERLFRERLDALADPLDPGFGFDLIRLSAGRTEIVVQQQRDLDSHVQTMTNVGSLIDRIAARIGGAASSCICRRIRIFLSTRRWPRPRSRRSPPRRGGLAARAPKASRRCGRLRLFERPEPIKVPLRPCPTARRINSPGAAPTHVVVRVEGPERIAMEWWKQDGKALTRDYFRVEDRRAAASGFTARALWQRTRDKRASRSANWFVHGLFA